MKRIAHIFGSYSKAQEIFLVLEGAKEVARQGFYGHELAAVEKFCKEKGLCLEISKFKVVLSEKSGFSNKGVRVPLKDKREGMRFVYISQDEQKALLAAYFELMGSDLDLGRVLGYPECCVKYFCSNFGVANVNPEHIATSAWTNLSKRDEDLVILSHFPCASDCVASIDLAQKYMDVLMRVDKDRAERLLTALKV